MANINAIKLPDGNKYNLVDETSGYITSSDLPTPLIGTTANTTPTQVKAALDAGRDVIITHTDSYLGTISAYSFNYSDTAQIINSISIINTVLGYYVVQLTGDLSENTWDARAISYPTKTSDLTNDSGFITSYTETDPIFSASAAAEITSSDINNWNSKISDDGKWNGVSLTTSTADVAVEVLIPTLESTSSTSAKLAHASTTPSSYKIAKYESGGYLKSTTPSANDNSTKVATTAYVDSAITALPEPMIFKGSLGTGGTITTLPTASSSNEGFTYKVITDGTYASQSAKIGDTFISDGSSWVLIPSGDEPSGTVTSVAVSNATNGGLSISGSPITSSGTISIGHSNVLSAAQTTQAVYPIKIDKNGHISEYGSAVSIPSKTSDLTNDSGFITLGDLPIYNGGVS